MHILIASVVCRMSAVVLSGISACTDKLYKQSLVDVALLLLVAQVHYNAAVACTDDLVSAVDDCGFDCKLLSVHNLSGGADEQDDRPQVRSMQALAAARAKASAAACLSSKRGTGQQQVQTWHGW
jgi:hypothetical protein